jgi:hypothetical protein
MPTSKSSGRSSRSKASSARKATSTSAASRRQKDEAAREQLQRFLDPREVVVVTRERLQEVLDEAVARGRMTRDDAGALLSDLLARGRLRTGPRCPRAGRRSACARATTRRGVAGSAERVLREVDRARRAAGVGPSFPILGYDDLTAAQVNERLAELGPAELRKVRDYEKRNANRKSVLAAVEQKLK